MPTTTMRHCGSMVLAVFVMESFCVGFHQRKCLFAVASTSLRRSIPKRHLHSPSGPFSSQRRLPFRTAGSSHLLARRHFSQQRRFWSILFRGGEQKKEASENVLLPATADLAVRRLDGQTSSLLGDLPVSVCSIRGYRSHMEDDFCLGHDMAAVFDGHGGSKVSQYLRHNLYAEVQAALPKEVMPSVPDFETALEVALQKVNEEVHQIAHWSYQGSTAVAAYIHEEKKDPSEDVESSTNSTIRTLITANVGDSRAVLSHNATAVTLTRDHKPEDPIEQERIRALGGTIFWHGHLDRNRQPIPGTGVYRVNGNLAMSRAIGDRSERRVITADPDITTRTLSDDLDDFVVLATDGLWDVMTSQEVVKFIHGFVAKSMERDDIVRLLVEEALRRKSYDNITVLVVWLHSRYQSK